MFTLCKSAGKDCSQHFFESNRLSGIMFASVLD
jgi:hypothetical protein